MSTVEERLAVLEVEVQAVKCQLARIDQPRAWLDAVAGSMDPWPEFEEVLQLGRAFRQSMRDASEKSAEGG